MHGNRLPTLKISDESQKTLWTHWKTTLRGERWCLDTNTAKRQIANELELEEYWGGGGWGQQTESLPRNYYLRSCVYVCVHSALWVC